MSFLKNPRVIKGITIAGFTVAFAALFIGYFIAAIFGTQNYNIIDNYISDMGASEFTPFPYMRTISNLISGPLLLPFTFYMRKQLAVQVQENQGKKTPLIPIAFIGMLTIFLGMMMTGIITLDVHAEIHTYLALIAIAGGAIATISYGIVSLRFQTSIPKGLGMYMVIVLPIIGVLFIIGWPSKIFYEWILLFSLYSWMISFAVILLRKS